MDPSNDNVVLSDWDEGSLDVQLKPIKSFMAQPGVTEVVINRPGEVRVETHEGWTTHQVAEVTQQWCASLAKVVANSTGQRIKEASPLMGGTLGNKERIQLAVGPAVPDETPSITIRIPGLKKMTVQDYIDAGAFSSTRVVQSYTMSAEERESIEKQLTEEELKLLALLRDRDFIGFLKLAVEEKKNLVVSGSTGAGKTTLSNALYEFLPRDDRIITVEDTREAQLPEDMNVVHMLYSKGGQGRANLTAKDVLEATLRMRPDRVFPAELRGSETFFFVQNVLNSGHPGTITTVHSNSTLLAFLRLSLMIKGSEEGGSLDRQDILSMLFQLIDVVVQIRKVKVDGKSQRVITEIYYDPAFARKQMG